MTEESSQYFDQLYNNAQLFSKIRQVDIWR